MTAIERWLRRHVRHKEIGWTEIGERFTRFHPVRLPFLNVFIHKLDAPYPHPHCHDHPWSFWTVLLAGGYWETTAKGTVWRRPGLVLYRPATWRHNVVTRGVSWSLVIASGKVRPWRIVEELDADCRVPAA